MKHRVVGLAVVAASVFSACDNDRRAISRDDLPDVPAEATVSVELGDDGFDQAELEITTVDLVEFLNVGEENHGVRTEDYAIDTGALFPDESTLIIFDTPGRYEVFDTEDRDSTMTVLARPPGAP